MYDIIYYIHKCYTTRTNARVRFRVRHTMEMPFSVESFTANDVRCRVSSEKKKRIKIRSIKRGQNVRYVEIVSGCWLESVIRIAAVFWRTADVVGSRENASRTRGCTTREETRHERVVVYRVQFIVRFFRVASGKDIRERAAVGGVHPLLFVSNAAARGVDRSNVYSKLRTNTKSTSRFKRTLFVWRSRCTRL